LTNAQHGCTISFTVRKHLTGTQFSMIISLTICAISLAMLKWHSQPGSLVAAIAEPTTEERGRFGYDNSRIASLFKGSI